MEEPQEQQEIHDDELPSSMIISWPSKDGAHEDVIARGVIKGGLWLAVILGGIAILVAVGKVSYDSYQKESTKNKYGAFGR